MTAVTQSDAPNIPKKSKGPLLFGLVLAFAGAGGGFFAVSSGILFGDNATADHGEGAAHRNDAGTADLPVAFVALDPLVISLPGDQKFLRFTAQLEVEPAQQATVDAIRPRIVDVLNGYLRAVDVTELSDPAALIRLRAQMLRRVQIVAGPGTVRDLLIMEFVLN